MFTRGDMIFLHTMKVVGGGQFTRDFVVGDFRPNRLSPKLFTGRQNLAKKSMKITSKKV